MLAGSGVGAVACGGWGWHGTGVEVDLSGGGGCLNGGEGVALGSVLAGVIELEGIKWQYHIVPLDKIF